MDSRIPLPGGLWGASRCRWFQGWGLYNWEEIGNSEMGTAFPCWAKGMLVPDRYWEWMGIQPEDPQAESPSFGAGKGDSDLSDTGIVAAAWHEA